MLNSTTIKKSFLTNPVKSQNVSLGLNFSDLSDYLTKVNALKSIGAAEEKLLALRVKMGDKDAKQSLIQANLKLVITIARKVIHVSKLPLVDLIQEGNLGLITAVEKYDPQLGFRFSTYASWWIKQAMFKAISEQSYCMKIPVYIQEKLSKFSKIKAEMERISNRQISATEVAAQMKIEPEKIDTYLSAFTSTVSLEGSFEGNNGSELAVSDVVADENGNVEDFVQYEELKREVANVISTLKEREQTVIKMRFGLENFAKTTLEDIGKLYGVTKECIRQTELRALNKLKVGAELYGW